MQHDGIQGAETIACEIFSQCRIVSGTSRIVSGIVSSVGQDVLTVIEVLSGEFEHLKHPCMAHRSYLE